MLIQSGKIKDGKWAGIEVTSESRIDEIVLHLTKWLVSHVGEFQLLFPVESRALEVTMLSPYLWVRVKDFGGLSKITSIMGVQGLVSGLEGILLVEDAFVQELIEKAKKISDSWSSGITQGSSVRVLLGSERMLCGVVEKTHGDMAEVRIALKSRSVRLKVPIRALQNLGSEPKDYFYKESL